jgi:hypothetical protein
MGRRSLGVALAGGLTASCAGGPAEVAQAPGYLWAETLRMSQELVNIRVGAAYADCVASNYALSQGFAFARHVRTTVTEEGGVWLGDAVYTISPAIPEGLRTIDAETKVAACGESGIPTV